MEGLEFIDEEELESDERDKAPAMYLLVPDARAMGNIVSLWRRWSRGEAMADGFTPWRDVFATLRDLRSWGPQDRLRPEDITFVAEEIALKADSDLIRLEIELVFRDNETRANETELELGDAIISAGGRVVSRCRILDIRYHALLTELPVGAAKDIVALAPNSIVGLDPVMHIRPQSTATSIEVGEPEETTVEASPALDRSPILALLDGVPVAQHPLLAGSLNIDDQFGLESIALVSDRHHGTAMASLIVCGDRNRSEQRLARRVHVVPVLGAKDMFPEDRLIIDVIYLAVLAMRSGREPSAPDVLIVNLSLGNAKMPFHGQMSAWARLIDRLSYRFGILFIVSAGNHTGSFVVPNFVAFSEYQKSVGRDRSHASISALGQLVATRRLLSPSESINCVTVGAANEDAVSPNDRTPSSLSVDPFPTLTMANPSSAFGPGFANGVKPDILMPGGKEHLGMTASGAGLSVKPRGAARAHGIKVAAPPTSGNANFEHYTDGTSAASALASRACHQIHDALEATYGDVFSSLSHAHRSTLLKALLVHSATWPSSAAELIKSALGPLDNRQHVRQKDNIRRFLGYGVADPEAAITCTDDRATFWATNTLARDKAVLIHVPIPMCVNGLARPHALSATLAWFSPVVPGRRSYRAVRLKLLDPVELSALRVDAASSQPDKNQSQRGTIFSRRWEGDLAPVLTTDQMLTFTVQRDPDQSQVIDEPVPFGIAITFTMPGVIQVYDEVRARLNVEPRVAVR